MFLRRTLSDIADALWSPSEGPEPRARVALPIFLGVTLSIALLLVLRRIDGITNAQFWAEDGLVFFQENLKAGCWRALQTFFRGFPYLGQRLVACAATSVPFARVPLVYNTVAYFGAAACLATFSLPAFRHVIRRDALRIVFCLVVAAMPPAKELIGSLTNTSWFLGIWLMLLTIARLPESPLALSALASAVVLATFSAPLVVVTVPLWFARALHAVRGRRLREACFSAVALASVFALVGWAGDLGRRPGPVPFLAGPLLNAISTRVLAALVLDPATIQSLDTRLGSGAVYAVAIAALVVVTVLAWCGQRRIVPVLLYCAYGVVASIALAFIGFPNLALSAASVSSLFRTQGWFTFAGRYQVLPVGMVYLAFLAVIDRLPGGRRWSVATVLLLAWLVATQAATFVLPPFRDLQWPVHAARLERKYADRNPDPVLIPVNPDPSGVFFHIAVDLRTIAPETPVPRGTILGSVLRGTKFEQSFIARCSNLSEIDLWFGKEGGVSPQTVHVQLQDAGTGHVEATFIREAPQLVYLTLRTAKMIQRQAKTQGTKVSREDAERFAMNAAVQKLYFAPIRDSHGKRYLISVTASGGAPGNSISVYGSTAATYPDGEARRDAVPIPGDLVFQYGCTSE
jgi:hypothetical protein